MMAKEVLIVEDKWDYRDSIKRAFSKSEGYVFHEAASVDEGIAVLERHPSVRVIILDLLLQDKSGVELLEWIKPRASGYRVIIHTGHEQMLTAEIAREYGAFYYQAKGDIFSVQSIRFAVDQAFHGIEGELLRKKIGKHLEIQQRINANERLQDILEAICEATRELIGGYTCHIRLFDLKKGDYLLAAYSGPPRVRSIFDPPKKLSEHYSGRVAKDNKPHIAPDIQNEPEFEWLRAQFRAAGELSKEAEEYLDTVRSAYIVPISTNVFENEVDAVFNINSAELDYFTEERRKIADDFISQASLAIAKDWLRNKREEVHKDYSLSSNLLVQISEQLKGDEILKNIYRIVIEGIAEIINPEMISIFLYNERTKLLEKVAERIGSRLTHDSDETYKPGQSFTGKVYETGKTIRQNNNPTHHPDYGESTVEIDRRKLPSRQISHYLGVPLRTGNKTIGVIRAVNKKSGYYDELGEEKVRDDETCLLKRGFSTDCETVLSIIASHLSVAIKNGELINKMSGRIDQLQALTQVARKVSSNYEMGTDELLELIVHKAAEVTNSVICMLFLKDGHEDRVVLKQAYGLPEDKIDGIFYMLGKGKTGEVALTGKSKLEIQAEKSHVGRYDDLILEVLREAEGEQAGIESFMAVPITVEESRVSGRETIGVLKVINKKHDHLPFDEDDVKVFETFASQIAVALAIAERSYALAQIVGGVCHEINNSATAIPIFVNKVKELLGRPELGVGERLDRIYILAKQMVEFSNDLLGFTESRMQDRKPSDINVLVEKALEHFSADTINIDNFQQVDVSLRLSEHPILCEVNDTVFIHIARNIIANAYHAMEGRPEGRLEVRTYVEPSDGIAHIEFADNGHGIKQEHIPKIYRSDFSTKKGAKRNGLGLWLVQTYLRRMGGDISVESVYGRGATFTIRMPTLKGGAGADA
jgi:signal transduction histidine kinase/ActR/RegA family two-component response regulator